MHDEIHTCVRKLGAPPALFGSYCCMCGKSPSDSGVVVRSRPWHGRTSPGSGGSVCLESWCARARSQRSRGVVHLVAGLG